MPPGCMAAAPGALGPLTYVYLVLFCCAFLPLKISMLDNETYIMKDGQRFIILNAGNTLYILHLRNTL